MGPVFTFEVVMSGGEKVPFTVRASQIESVRPAVRDDRVGSYYTKSVITLCSGYRLYSLTEPEILIHTFWGSRVVGVKS